MSGKGGTLFRTLNSGDKIVCDGACVVEILERSGRSTRVKITSDHHVDFVKIQAQECHDQSPKGVKKSWDKPSTE